MTTVHTNLRNTRESARQIRFEPSGTFTATNVQKAIEESVGDLATKQDKVGTARFPTAAATVAVLTSDQEVGISTTATAVSVNLPTATAWAAANPNGLELVVFDNTGQGDTHNITPVPSGGDVFVGGLTPLVTSPYGLIKLRPIPGTGWYLRQ